METPAQREARCLIEKIHREHTLDGKILGTRFELLVSNCLEILSSQLYEKSTHFLLELIQNADDNTYHCSRPTLSFSYKPGSLRIDCNEVGFNAENVEAICAISRSTKSGKTSDGEYIGEKGIGFKSVFKAADVVWISSRDFTFKFDKTKFLGMVAPVWETFPEKTQPGCTSIYLQLSKGYEEDTLIQELLTFDTNLLIFLRRVEEIHIRVNRRDEEAWEKKFRKDESQQGVDRLTVLYAGEETFRYLIRTHVIKDLPKERKRPNWPQTRILLAFPITESQEQPRLIPQNVYAFLPIRNFGLKFLLQGDFLLTASREDIESTLPWNCTIRDALAEAFLMSIDHFNKGQLKYVWPYYLPSTSTAACSFLEPAVTSILTKLRESDVLESCAETMVKASSLKHVPLDPFADGEGIPFTLGPLTATSYLSLKYPAWAIEATSSIGVSQLSPQEFLADLNSTIVQDPTTFRTRSATWHSQLAVTLIKLTTDPELMSIIQDMYLIPLHDGTWTSASRQSIFFSKSETSLEIPSGIEVLIVDSTAESDTNRRKLFRTLGVKAWEAPEICRLVLKVHESSSFDPKTLTVVQLISHAAFLYKASWQPPKTADLWFATMQDERCLGRKLYIPGSIEPNSPASRIFAQLQKQFAVIHNGYLTAFPLDTDWPIWLVSNLSLSKVPRLITPHVDPKPQPTPTLETHEGAIPDGDLDSSGNPSPRTRGPGMLGRRPSHMQRRPKPPPPPENWRDYPLPPHLRSGPGTPPRPPKNWPSGLPPPQLRGGPGAPPIPPPPQVRPPLLDWQKPGESPPTTGGASGLAPSIVNLGPQGQPGSRSRSTRREPTKNVLGWAAGTSTKARSSRKEKPIHTNVLLVDAEQAITGPVASDNGTGLRKSQLTRAEYRHLDAVDQVLLRLGVDSDRTSDNSSRSSSLLSVSIKTPIFQGGQEDSLEGKRRVETVGDVRSKETLPKITTSATDGDAEKTFTLSEEFTFMFRECHSSDVLQLLRDNWNHYSQWIDGAHMKWQNNDFLESSTKLRNSLGAYLVQSAKGPLPLQETVLPMIDPQFDEGRFIPAVDIKEPQHPEWTLLSYFGVIIKADIHYYLRCLISISGEHCPDVDSVAYIYEQIQARYKEYEGLIGAAFHERDIIFIHSKLRGWFNMKECISRDITIESEYPSSSYLFRCLISPRGDPIAPIIATATLITSSTKLEDISRLFRNVSTALKDVNTSKAAQLLRPLQNKSVFPIINSLGKRKYNKLLDLHNTSWYIADRPLIRESFLGKLPLLALPIEDLSALEDLFRVLRLDNRILSKLSTSRTQKRGRTTTDWPYTSSLRKKSPFIKALIPQSHPNRMTIVRQIEEVRVSVATDISQTFMLNIAGTEILGGDVRGQVSISYTENFLNLLMTEECAVAKCPPYELATLIADACGIKDPKHFSLLYTALSNSSLESINTSFKEQGIYIKGLVFDKSKDRYRAQRGDLMRIPSPFWGRLSCKVGSFRGSAEALWFGSSQTGRNIYDPDGDRRLSMMRLSEDTQSRRLIYEDEKLDGWDHIQYLGEHMISKVWHTYLGLAYDPERDWTSKLRSRSGYKLFEDSTPCAAFTMRDPKIREQMTAFVIKYGQSQTPNWKENLRANPPVYHLDLAVNAGSRTSSFVITTSQVERMQQFRMPDNANDSNSDVVILIRVSDVYSEDLLSIDLFVDPWRLFSSNNLTFEGTWITKGTIQENTSGSAKKRRKLDTLSVSWATPAISAIHENALTSARGHRSKETFTHRALDSGNIRLLYLLPGETGDQLQGVIIHVPYKSPGAYRALSYVWGTDQRTKKLVTPDGTLQITSSLNKALQGLRHREKPIMLWVDAICINQKDNTEKAQQIRLLPKIFQNAASTYAFLEGGKGSDNAIRMLMQVRFKSACDEKSKLERERADEEAEENIEIELAGETNLGESTKSRKRTSSNRLIYSKDWPEDLPRVPASWKHRSIPDLDAAIWSSVGALFRLPWFRRVWIIQEIVGAPHVKIICGKWIIDWNDLHLAMEIIDREVQMSDNDSSHLKSSWEPFLALAAQREWEARHYRWTLIMLLENFRYAESTLSRDRLFALLGLASDGNEAEFEPDYDSPLEDIVLKFTRVFVRQGRGMQMLYRAGLNHESDRFPSWIPDWTVKRASSLHDSSEGGVSFAASGPQQCKIKCIDNTDELLVDGYEVDEIESISKASNVEEEWEKYFNEVDTMIDSAILAPVRHLLEDLKWKVPIAGVLWPKVAVSGGLDLKSSYTAFRNYLYSKQKGKAKENGNSVNGCPLPTEDAMFIEHRAVGSYEKQATSYIAALQDTLHGWRFVVTKNGYIGVVPNMTKVGDVIAILKGGSVPFVLKRSEKRDGAFRLVGECYVHCLMNGEGLSLPGIREGEFLLH